MGGLAILDPVPQNFIWSKRGNGKRELVYVDNLNPYTIESETKPSRRNIDIDKLRSTILQKFPKPEDKNTQTRLLSYLSEYEELTQGMDVDRPASSYRKKTSIQNLFKGLSSFLG